MGTDVYGFVEYDIFIKNCPDFDTEKLLIKSDNYKIIAMKIFGIEEDAASYDFTTMPGSTPGIEYFTLDNIAVIYNLPYSLNWTITALSPNGLVFSSRETMYESDSDITEQKHTLQFGFLPFCFLGDGEWTFFVTNCDTNEVYCVIKKVLELMQKYFMIAIGI